MAPDDFRKLVAAGLSSEQIALVMEMMDRDAKAYAEADEARKAKGRERVAKWRLEHPRNVTVPLQNVTVPLTGGDAHVEDKPLTSEIEPQEESKKERRRASRLSPDWTLPVEWRSDAIKAGLPESRIDLEALNMRDWSLSSPNGTKVEWRAAWRTWCRRSAKDLPRAGPSPPKPKTAADFLMAETMERVNGHSRQETSDWADASGVSGIAVAGTARRLGIPDGR
jgi:hypothetical protein